MPELNATSYDPLNQLSLSERILKYETFKRENDEHLLQSLTNLFPHEDMTNTVRANIALEVYGQKYAVNHIMREWTDRIADIEATFADVSGVPDAKLDDKKAIRKAAKGSKKAKKNQMNLPF